MIVKQNQINQVSDFHSEWDDENDSIIVLYKNVELIQLLDNMPHILNRQLGYGLKISELFQTGLEFHSAECTLGKQNDPDEMYHENFYFFTEAVSETRVSVLVKYLDPPSDVLGTNPYLYFVKIKEKVKASSNLKMVYSPFGVENNDFKLIAGGFDIRQKQNGPFYFTTEFDADTYGDVMLKVDQIIRSLEN